MDGEQNRSVPVVSCDACGISQGPLLKVSLARDFFGRAYDRLSPASDKNPKWYCDPCSRHKTLQRDVRDIKAEFEKLRIGDPSTLSTQEQFQRARQRLQDILTALDGESGTPRLLEPREVSALLSQMDAHTGAASAKG
ncbi:MAG: hypothetical protein ACREI3_07155 [Nitrospirales bacterium]